MIREEATVLSNEPCYEGGYVIWLDAPNLAAAGHTPGQFVMVRCAPEGGDPEFSRAFSYHRAEEGRIALLYTVAGRGTGGWRGAVAAIRCRSTGRSGTASGFPTAPGTCCWWQGAWASRPWSTWRRWRWRGGTR